MSTPKLAESRKDVLLKDDLMKLAEKEYDPKLDIELELYSRIKEAYDKAVSNGYKGSVDEFIKATTIKNLREISGYSSGGPVVDFTGLDIPTMRAIFRSENGRDAKSAKELVRGIKMYLKGMDIKGLTFGSFD